MELESQNVCYVCFEEGAPPSQCACNTCIHDACLLKTLRATNKPYCTVCEEPYKNVIIQVVTTRRINAEHRFTLILSMLCGAMVICATVTLLSCLATYTEEHAVRYNVLVVCSAMFYLVAAIGGCLCIYCAVNATRHNIPFWYESNRMKSIRLVTSTHVSTV